MSATSTTDISRRDVLIGGSLAGMSGLIVSSPAAALAEEQAVEAPIAVLGASGRTGALCVMACLERGLPVRALTRSGSWEPPEPLENNQNLLTVLPCDVKDAAAIEKGIQGCQGVIYAASASKKGGNAKLIDNLAVVAAGNACRKQNVGRYVVISSTATTRPKSLGYQFTNVFGGIMEEKRKGETGIQAMYNSGDNEPSYTILRPGGLEEPKLNKVLGPSSLEISQGDTLAGIVSRADLAQVAVELALSNAINLKNTAVELYYTDSAQACEGRFKPLLTNGVTPRLHGDTYQELLRGIRPGIDYDDP